MNSTSLYGLSPIVVCGPNCMRRYAERISDRNESVVKRVHVVELYVHRVHRCGHVTPNIASSVSRDATSLFLRAHRPLCFRGKCASRALGARRASRERARGCEAAGIVSENHHARTLGGGKRA